MTALNPMYGTPIDGFWLPSNIRQRLLQESVEAGLRPAPTYASLSFVNGRECQPGDPGAVTSRWPQLQREQWAALLALLEENRSQAPRGKAFWERLQAALQAISLRLARPDDELRRLALQSLPSYTGYSEPMIRSTLSALDLFALDQMPAAFDLPMMKTALTWQCSQEWQKMPGLPGYIRFYPAQGWQSALHRLPGLDSRAIFSSQEAPETLSTPDLVVGYGAGNVPGAALLVAFLAQATTLAHGEPPPAVIIKNSRREPIFSPLILQALEAVDPELVATIAVLIWDYEDTALEEFLLSRANLVIAAASDETIAQIRSQIKTLHSQQIPGRPVQSPPRFHEHGHKVSFAAIGQEVLARGASDPQTGQPLLDVVALLAALDSVFWDQHGCLSARLHFVEEDPAGSVAAGYGAADYAASLKRQLGLLAHFLPRGAWPLQQIHDRFDRYKQLEVTQQVQVLSEYQDEFLVVVDRRPLNPAALQSLVNDCQGRVIIVRPVGSLMEIPTHYLSLLPAANLQSLSIAAGLPGKALEEPLEERLQQFFTACGACGVTAIRSVGRGAFPQLSYSWDGLIPLDLVYPRGAGHFTTIEFDRPYDQILETYRLMQRRGAALGLAPDHEQSG